MGASINQRNKELVFDLWARLDHAAVTDLRRLLGPVVHPDIRWFGPHPVNELRGRDEVIAGFWEPRESRFSEMALYVLVRRGREWWLAAGQNTLVSIDH